MSNDASFAGRVNDRVFIPDDIDRWRRVLRSREGKRTRVTIGPEQRRRTDRQNDYYWPSIVRAFAQWTSGEGHPGQRIEDEVHGMLLREVLVPMLPERFLIPTPSGTPLQGEGSTRALTTDEMNEYIAKCRIFLAERWSFETPDIDHVPIRRR